MPFCRLPGGATGCGPSVAPVRATALSFACRLPRSLWARAGPGALLADQGSPPPVDPAGSLILWSLSCHVVTGHILSWVSPFFAPGVGCLLEQVSRWVKKCWVLLSGLPTRSRGGDLCEHTLTRAGPPCTGLAGPGSSQTQGTGGWPGSSWVQLQCGSTRAAGWGRRLCECGVSWQSDLCWTLL